MGYVMGVKADRAGTVPVRRQPVPCRPEMAFHAHPGRGRGLRGGTAWPGRRADRHVGACMGPRAAHRHGAGDAGRRIDCASTVPDLQKNQARRWRRLRPRSRADATSTWRNDDDGSQETNGPHDPEGHRRTGAEGAAGRPVRADPTATHRRGTTSRPYGVSPSPTRGSHAPDVGGRPPLGGGGRLLAEYE